MATASQLRGNQSQRGRWSSEPRCPTLQLSAWHSEKPTLLLSPQSHQRPGPAPRARAHPPEEPPLCQAPGDTVTARPGPAGTGRESERVLLAGGCVLCWPRPGALKESTRNSFADKDSNAGSRGP